MTPASERAIRESDLHRQAEALASPLPPLLVAAERIAATVSQGVHGRRRVGQGETFWQYRRYEWGDQVSAIDWRQSAKSDRVFVRELEWEAAQSIWLWRDGSASMDYRAADDRPSKMDRADVLVVALSSLLIRAGERVALLETGMRPSSGRATLARMVSMLADHGRGLGDEKMHSLPTAEFVPRHGRVVLFGDFLSPLDDIAQSLALFAKNGVSGHLVQVLDPSEETLPFQGRVDFQGTEGEGSLLIGRVEAVRDAYRDVFRDHQAGLAALARGVGWSLSTHFTSTPPEPALLSLYIHMAETRSLDRSPTTGGRV